MSLHVWGETAAHWTWQKRTSFTMEIGNHFISGPTYADYFQTVLVHVLANFHPYHNGWRKLVTLRCYVLLIRKRRSTLLFLPQAFQCRDADQCFPNTQLSPALTVKKWKTNNQTKKLKGAGKGELANKALQKIFPDYYYIKKKKKKSWRASKWWRAVKGCNLTHWEV